MKDKLKNKQTNKEILKTKENSNERQPKVLCQEIK